MRARNIWTFFTIIVSTSSLIWITLYFAGVLTLSKVNIPRGFGMSLKNVFDMSSAGIKATPPVVYQVLPVDKRLFQSVEEVEFPTIPGDHYRIPHIIHQVFTDEMVPEVLAPLMRSFIKHNPKWTYMFWTYEAGRKLIEKTHPYLLKAYTSYKSSHGVKKSDLLRWLVLYEFGGLYADVDVSNLRPLDIATKKYACIVPVEPFEHAALYGIPYFVSNAVVLCRPKHPFVQYALMNLVDTSDEGHPVTVSGPGFVTKMYDAYNKINESEKKNAIKKDMSTNSPVFYHGSRDTTDEDAVYVPNSQYLMDAVAPVVLAKYINICNSTDKISELRQRACAELEARKEVRKNQKFTLTEHHWLHLWTYSSLDALGKVNISTIIPNRIIYPNLP